MSGTATSSISIGTLADSNCSNPNGSPPCGAPHHENHKASRRLLVAGLSTSSTAGYGFARAAAHASTSIAGHTKVTFRTAGALDGAATCKGRSLDGVCPGGEQQAAFVYSYADAVISGHVTATGRVPYVLDAILRANGSSKAPCAGATLVVQSGATTVESLAVNGPSAEDPGCSGMPGRVSVHHEGFIDASSGAIDISLAADTSFIDPGTSRTDKLHADWDVTVTFYSPCTISVTDLPGYDPLVGATMVGTLGDDVICGGDGPDTLIGHAGTDRIFGGAGDDLIEGHGTLLGEEGNDYICGQAGNDAIDGGDGHDTITGGPGNDVIRAGDGDDLVLEGAGSLLACGGYGTAATASGDDTILGGVGNDRIDGGTGNDAIYGGPGKDDLTGGVGLDLLDGGAGNDRLRGLDRRRDTLRCGPGRDTATADRVDRRSGCERVRFRP